ncbi:hypothetical protein LOK49_LG08G02942 [Camellia lanceoleosa]|uniref:Uncharacterized protein n=1 Tax=Camellia lanceoleosa TaxID=1840588 RepID=A0ACC0GU32_9ERIC|nr:hypothetical protein LOK49_LG08G02942 [Camellia lanceoleosa]
METKISEDLEDLRRGDEKRGEKDEDLSSVFSASSCVSYLQGWCFYDYSPLRRALGSNSSLAPLHSFGFSPIEVPNR